MKATEGQGDVRFWIGIEGKRIEVIDTHDYAEVTDYKQSYVKQMCDEGTLIATKYNGRWWIHIHLAACYVASDLPLGHELS